MLTIIDFMVNHMTEDYMDEYTTDYIIKDYNNQDYMTIKGHVKDHIDRQCVTIEGHVKDHVNR